MDLKRFARPCSYPFAVDVGFIFKQRLVVKLPQGQKPTNQAKVLLLEAKYIQEANYDPLRMLL